jgi:ABC-type Mn2+/Zn2+ transport system permease subunit
MAENFLNLGLMLVVAAASGLVGVFAIMRKMTLAGDSISHIALPGLGLALIFKINPFIGGAIALLLGAFMIWGIEEKTKISTETVIGVFFSASLALGALITPDHELIEALFGDLSSLTPFGAAIGVGAALAVILFIILFKNKLTLAIISEDLALVSGIKVSAMNLFFLLIFSLDVLLGLQFLGALLMGSLIIVPAAFARNTAHSLNGALFLSVMAAMASVGLGYWVSGTYGWDLGPTIISIAASLFFLSFLKQLASR